MPKTFGIEQTKDVLEFGDKLADELTKAKSDGVISAAEALAAFHASRKELVLACVGACQIPHEMGDLTAEEANELRELASKVFAKFIGLFGPFPVPTRALATLGAGIGIRETNEVLQFLSGFADCLAEAKKDGKITVPELISAFKKSQNDFFNAAWDSWLIPAELSELDETEARMLSEKTTQVITKYLDIFSV
jgi:hypothetical protein